MKSEKMRRRNFLKVGLGIGLTMPLSWKKLAGKTITARRRALNGLSSYQIKARHILSQYGSELGNAKLTRQGKR